MPGSNLRQADVPEGATVIEQRTGTAPGLICPVGDDGKQVVYAVPGVPYEMREMLERAVLPDLAERAGVRRSEEHTSELQSLMRLSYAVFCLKNKNQHSLH